MSSRVYVGNLGHRTTERDLEGFFKGFGRLREIILKKGFGFVEFEDNRDADDAIYELNGKDLCGSRITVEACRRGPSRGGEFRDRGRGGGDFRDRGGYRGDDRRPQKSNRYGPPVQTRYRLVVENLSTRCSWQDLKDLMRQSGEVTYADAHKKERNTAVVCFASHEDLKRAMDKYQGKDINGREIKLIDETRSASRSRSRSKSPRRRSPASRSRSPRKRSSRSRSHSRTRSGSPVGNGRSVSRSPI